MSRARRNHKRRLVIGLVSAAVVSGAVATGVAMAGEGGGSPAAAAKAPGGSGSCKAVAGQAAPLVAKGKKGVVLDLSKASAGLPQMDARTSGLLTAAGVGSETLQKLQDTLWSVPVQDIGVEIEGAQAGGARVPQVKLTSLDQKDPKDWAQANPEADLGQMTAGLAALNSGLAKFFSGSGGLDNLQAAFGEIAVNSVIDIDDVELEIKKAETGRMQLRVNSATDCEAGAPGQQ